MRAHLLALLALATPVLAEHPSWTVKVAQGRAVLDYLETGAATVPEPFPETPAELPADRKGERVVALPPHLPTWQIGDYLRADPAPDAATGPATRWITAARQPEGGWRPTGRARWPNGHSTRVLERLQAPTRKGLGGLDQPRGLEDLVDLGIGHATVNIHLSGLLHPESAPGRIPFPFEGRDYFLHPGWLRKLDRTIGFLTTNRIVVSAIILVTPPRAGERHLLTHPETTAEATLAMPNISTPEGCHAFRAAIEFLAERYTRERAEHGRISNWIAFNEVDQAWTWTNMGEQPMPRLLETYHRAMRLIHLGARRYDPHARVFASFTHHWFHAGDGRRTYRTREMLRLLARLSKAEGDFGWGVAYHPYPQNLRVGATWRDTQPTFTFDTPKITMKNIEVLDAFLRQPAFLFEGHQRPILLSEQGFNTRDYSPEQQQIQAAALVYTWEKLRALPAIEAFHYHRWLDHPKEGGLRLGLRTLPTPGNPLGEKKLGWEIYRALDTPAEAEATRTARELLPDPALIPHRGPIPAPTS